MSLVVEADTIAESKEDFKGTAYFVKGSEKCFDVFEYNGLTVYSRSTFSCQIKIRPDLLDAFFQILIKNSRLGFITTIRLRPIQRFLIILELRYQTMQFVM